MIIACLGEITLDIFSQHKLNVFITLEALLESKKKWSAIFLASIDDNLALETLRRHETLCLIPIFTVLQTNETPLCDGYCENEIIVINKITHLSQRLDALNLIPLDPKSRFLAYCYSRAPLDISPHTDWSSPTYYHYPIADLFIEKNYHTPNWLNELAEKNFLTKGKLLHSQFICSHCESGHLSFTERCPNCHNEDITQCPFLHCFTCGLIAPETEFIQGDRLKCPKCNGLLRHVGEDYDRPLESGQCFNCHEFYQEAELWVKCMMCKKNYSPDRLGKSNSRHYHITESNAADILNTYFMQHLNVFDEINYIESPFFIALLDWLFALNQRYPEEAFSLIGFTIKLSPEVIPFLHHFAEQLKGILRTTDVLTRILDEEIWLLLPKTNEEGLNIVLSRINNAKASFSEMINWKISSICSTQIPKDATMEKVFIMLRMQW